MPGASLVSTRRTPWVRGPSAVVDAMVLGGVTTDNQVYFERVVAYTSFKAKGGRSIVNPIGVVIDSVLNSDEAIGAAFVQDAGPSGLLQNFMEFTVAVPDEEGSLTLTDTALVPMQEVATLGLGYLESLLAQARADFAGAVGS